MNSNFEEDLKDGSCFAICFKSCSCCFKWTTTFKRNPQSDEDSKINSFVV